MCLRASTNARMASTKYALKALVGHSVADKLSDPILTALSEGIGNEWSSSAKSSSMRGTASSVAACCSLQCGLSAARAAIHHWHQLRYGTCPEASPMVRA